MSNTNQKPVLEEKKPRTFNDEFGSDPLKWGMFCFPDYFRVKSSYFHFKVMDAVMEFMKLAIAAPRGHAKSVLLVFVYPLFCIFFRRKHCIVIISNTERQASRHLRAIKDQVKQNKVLRKYFGILKFTKDTETECVFRHSDGFETLVVCKGIEQVGTIRGTRHGAYRVDLVIGDDMEDDELVASDQRRKKLREELDDVLDYAGDPTTQFIFVGTILHDDSQLAKLVGKEFYPHYHKMFFKAHAEKSNRALWPEWVSLDFILDKKKNDPRSYAKELQNNPVAGMNTRFQKENFRLWKEQGANFTLFNSDGVPSTQGAFTDCKPAIACDLAWEEKKEADRAVILSALLTPTSDILIYKYIAERGLRPDRFINILFEMVNKMEKITGNRCPVGFEKAMLEKVVKWLLKKEMRARNQYILTRELSWERDKIKRIEIQLEPRYVNNAIYHRSGMGELEHELLRFPYGATDDIIDAEQGVCQLLQKPKSKKKEVTEDPLFETIRKMHIERHHPPKTGKAYQFGKKNQHYEIPFTKTYR